MGTLGLYDYQARADVGSNGGGAAAAAAAPAQPIALPPTFHPPAGARLLSLVLAAACPGAPAASAPKLSAFSDDFNPTGFDARWLLVSSHADVAGHDGGSSQQPDGGYGMLWQYDGYGNQWGAERATAATFDATAALLTFDLAEMEPSSDFTGVPGVGLLSAMYEDRAGNWRLRMRLGRFSDGSYRLDVGTERSEGAPAPIAAPVLVAGGATARAVRCGLDTDGTVRLELLRTPTGQPEQWEGIAGLPLPADFAAAWNPSAVHLHLAYETNAVLPRRVLLRNLRGSRPVGPAVAVGAAPSVAAPMKRLAHGTEAAAPYVVPAGRVAVVDSLAVALLVADGGAGDPAHPHAVADVFARVLVDGAPMEGLGELRPAAVLALGVAPVGTHFRVERRGLGLTLRAGQQLGAELVTADSNAAHVVALELDGWTFDGGE